MFERVRKSQVRKELYKIVLKYWTAPRLAKNISILWNLSFYQISNILPEWKKNKTYIDIMIICSALILFTFIMIFLSPIFCALKYTTCLWTQFAAKWSIPTNIEVCLLLSIVKLNSAIKDEESVNQFIIHNNK